MIIRTSPEREFTALPNAIFRDPRLSLEGKGLLGYLLSLPPSWEVRPAVVCKTLSADTGRPLGKDRLRRMFKELIDAGYMARTVEQTKDSDGFFGAYIYIVGADPSAVEAEADRMGVAFLPQAGLPSTGEPSTANPPPYKRTKERKNTHLQKENAEFEFSDAAITEAQQVIQEKQQPRVATNWQLSRDAFRVARGALKAAVHAERPEQIQDRIARRLGPRGWTILCDLSTSELDQLTAQERNGRLSDQHLAELHLRFPAVGQRQSA